MYQVLHLQYHLDEDQLQNRTNQTEAGVSMAHLNFRPSRLYNLRTLRWQFMTGVTSRPAGRETRNGNLRIFRSRCLPSVTRLNDRNQGELRLTVAKAGSIQRPCPAGSRRSRRMISNHVTRGERRKIEDGTQKPLSRVECRYVVRQSRRDSGLCVGAQSSLCSWIRSLATRNLFKRNMRSSREMRR